MECGIFKGEQFCGPEREVNFIGVDHVCIVRNPVFADSIKTFTSPSITTGPLQYAIDLCHKDYDMQMTLQFYLQ